MLTPLKLNQTGFFPFLDLLNSLWGHFIRKPLSGEGQIIFLGLMLFLTGLIQSPVESPDLSLFFVGFFLKLLLFDSIFMVFWSQLFHQHDEVFILMLKFEQLIIQRLMMIFRMFGTFGRCELYGRLLFDQVHKELLGLLWSFEDFLYEVKLVFGLEKSFNEEPDKFLYFLDRFVFGYFNGVNFIAKLLPDMNAPKLVNGLDQRLNVLDAVNESKGLQNNFVRKAVLKLFERCNDMVQMNAIGECLDWGYWLWTKVKPVEVLQIRGGAGHLDFVIVAMFGLRLGSCYYF